MCKGEIFISASVKLFYYFPHPIKNHCILSSLKQCFCASIWCADKRPFCHQTRVHNTLLQYQNQMLTATYTYIHSVCDCWTIMLAYKKYGRWKRIWSECEVCGMMFNHHIKITKLLFCLSSPCFFLFNSIQFRYLTKIQSFRI